MAKQILNSINLGVSNYTKPAEILSRMKELKVQLAEASEELTVKIYLELNALAKAFNKLLTEDFICSDDAIDTLLRTLEDSSYSISINNCTYNYSKETVIKPEMDKSYLASQGVKTLKALAEKMEAEGQAIPACIDISTKTIHSFKPEKWNGEAFAKEVSATVINIKEKETK